MATSATRKESEAIRQRMQEIRCELPYHMETARDEVRDHFNWKFQVRRHPILAASLVAVVAFLIVPAKKHQPSPPKQSRFRRLIGTTDEEHVEEVQRKTLMSGIVSSLLTLTLRSVVTAATRQLTGHFSNSLHRSFADRSAPANSRSESTRRETYR